MLVVYVSRPFDAVCCGSKGGCCCPVKQIERSTIWVFSVDVYDNDEIFTLEVTIDLVDCRDDAPRLVAGRGEGGEVRNLEACRPPRQPKTGGRSLGGFRQLRVLMVRTTADC